jgi:hypothetical protein
MADGHASDPMIEAMNSSQSIRSAPLSDWCSARRGKPLSLVSGAAARFALGVSVVGQETSASVLRPLPPPFCIQGMSNVANHAPCLLALASRSTAQSSATLPGTLNVNGSGFAVRDQPILIVFAGWLAIQVLITDDPLQRRLRFGSAVVIFALVILARLPGLEGINAPETIVLTIDDDVVAVLYLDLG